MTPVYLGFFEMLGEILRMVFDGVLKPVLLEVSKVIFELLGGLIFDMFKEVLFDGLVVLLKMVRALSMFFDVFSGLANVMVDDVSNGVVSGTQEMTFLQYLFRQSTIGTVLAYMTMIAGTLAFLFAIMATAKNISDSVLTDEVRPIEKVLMNGVKSAVTFMLVPIMCTFLLHLTVSLTDAVMDSLQRASGIESEMKMDDAIFLAVAQPAAKNSSTFENVYRKTSYTYVNRDEILKNFDIGKIDYIVGYTATILTIILMLGATLTFIRQCVDLLMLYLVSPFFSATIALDGGAKFKKWRELFIAKFFVGFGTIFSIQLFLMLMPFYTSDLLVFSQDVTMNNCIKLFFILGGAWSIFKGKTLIMEILSPDASRSANESMAMITWLVSRK